MASQTNTTRFLAVEFVRPCGRSASIQHLIEQHSGRIIIFIILPVHFLYIQFKFNCIAHFLHVFSDQNANDELNAMNQFR